MVVNCVTEMPETSCRICIIGSIVWVSVVMANHKTLFNMKIILVIDFPREKILFCINT